MRTCLLVVAGFLFGCSSPSFDVAPVGSESDSAIGDSSTDGAATPDTAADGLTTRDTLTPDPDTRIGPTDTGTPPPDTSVPPPDGCAIKTDADFYSTTYSTSGASVTTDTPVAIAFVMMRTAQPVSMTFALQRVDIDITKSAGSLVIRLIRGTPTLTPSASDVLTTVTVPATAMGDATSPIAIALGSALPVLAKGDHLWFELTDGSDRANFRVFGGAGTSSAVDLWIPVASSSTGYSNITSFDPYLVVSVKACF
jgi:hypothetical protein